ncbi:tumor protein p63-regulated gene 1 protein isoform X2 [Ambystoma mexicanum]|uniref:tumor protein p63-regulated gene 1 protein isoform X2 n=1 Tax=Ambystoma mexicanum TaxID=8296 RepID=UPI0037E8C562
MQQFFLGRGQGHLEPSTSDLTSSPDSEAESGGSGHRWTPRKAWHGFAEMSQTGDNEEFRPVELGDAAKPDPPALAAEKGDEAASGDQWDQKNPEGSSLATLDPDIKDRQYLLRKFFVARPGALEQAIEDLKIHVTAKEGETVLSFWLLAEVDHWNNEKERVVMITEKHLLICKYDFIMLASQQIQKIPLNYIDRICRGQFTFPQKSLDKREGEGVRLYWDKLREASVVSRWNPWSTDLPYTTFTDHPVKSCSERFAIICQVDAFTAELVQTVQKAHKMDPVPGRANGAVVLNQPILIETYAGFMSFIGNRNKLGYSLARGSVGF